jgi:hypothetical protein
MMRWNFQMGRSCRRIGENSPGCEKPRLKRSRIMSVGILANNMIALQYAIKVCKQPPLVAPSLNGV